jgi:hypothetical protein
VVGSSSGLGRLQEDSVAGDQSWRAMAHKTWLPLINQAIDF